MKSNLTVAVVWLMNVADEKAVQSEVSLVLRNLEAIRKIRFPTSVLTASTVKVTLFEQFSLSKPKHDEYASNVQLWVGIEMKNVPTGTSHLSP